MNVVPRVTLSVFVFAFATGLYIYLFTAAGIKPLYWIVAAIGLLIFALLSKAPSAALPAGLILWSLMYVTFLCASCLAAGDTENAVQRLVSSSEWLILFLLLLLALLENPSGINAVRLTLAATALLSVGMNILDFWDPHWTAVPGRAAGFQENPNIAALMIVLCMVASLRSVPPTLRFSFILFCGAGVFVTFSRGGWVLWLAACFGLLYLRPQNQEVSGGRRATWLVVAVVVMLTAFGSFEAFVSAITQRLDNNTWTRLKFLSAEASDDSAIGRLDVARYAYNVFLDNFWFGQGLGSSAQWGATQFVAPHNMYLMFAAEGGIVGLALYLSFCGLAWLSTAGEGRLLVILYCVSGLFTHNNFDHVGIAVLLATAFAGAAAQAVAPWKV